jgi:hypothetical protein
MPWNIRLSSQERRANIHPSIASHGDATRFHPQYLFALRKGISSAAVAG